jgi:hypothetical protein
MSNLIGWLKKNYMYVVVPVGAISLYKIVNYFSGGGTSDKSVSKATGYTKYMKYPELMNAILKGESNSYNDHNYYNPNLQGYVQGRWGRKYPAFTKNLSDYTIGEIIAFQNQSRSGGAGQLWAVGKYQIIPSTLKGSYAVSGLKLSDKFSPENQDKIGMALLKLRPKAWNYLTKKVGDTQDNLNSAALDIAMSWSSVGVPYALKGFWGVPVTKNESYYKPYDRATTDTTSIQKYLRTSRKG